MHKPLTTAEAAYVLGCSKQTVYVLVREHRLHVLYREGTRHFFHAQDVENMRLDRIAHPPALRQIYHGVPRGRPTSRGC